MFRRVRPLVAVMLTATAQAATQYTYDSLNRSTAVVYDDGRSIHYAYDAAGNLRSRQAVGSAPASAGGGLPHSGITPVQCYGPGNNALVDCSSSGALALSRAQDGMRASIRPASYSPVPHASGAAGAFYGRDDCVRDNVTGLVWEGKPAQHALRGAALTYTNHGDGRAGDASFYVAAVNALGLCGGEGWRLPTADELQTLVNYGVTGPGPAIDAAWFGNTVTSPQYWTSSPLGRPGLSMFVDFSSGDVGAITHASRLAVRLVRGALTAASTYELLANGSEVKDLRTGLIWRRCMEGMSWNGSGCAGTGGVASFNHQAALQQATAQQTADKPWRVPNVKELTSLLRRDRSEPQPFIDEAMFPGTPTTYFWSATPVARTPNFAWTTHFGYGSTGSDQNRAAAHPVRLVRSIDAAEGQPPPATAISISHAEQPAVYDNLGAGVAWGQTFVALAPNVNGLSLYFKDPSRPDDPRVQALKGSFSLELHALDIANQAQLLARKSGFADGDAGWAGIRDILFDQPATVVPSRRYFLAVRTDSLFGAGLRSLTTSTYGDGAEARLDDASQTVIELSGGRDLAFRVLVLPR